MDNQSAIQNSGARRWVDFIYPQLPYIALIQWARPTSLYLFGYLFILINIHWPPLPKTVLLKRIFMTACALTKYVFLAWMYI